MSERTFPWTREPRVAVVLPPERDPSWSAGARWCALLEAWGFPFEITGHEAPERWTTLLTPDMLPVIEGPGREDELAEAAFAVLEAHASAGLVGLSRWPHGKIVALVVDGDVDHPTGVDPECARYVAPAIETMRRAGYDGYGIFAAAANVDAEPGSFPPGAEYYNHSFSHPYSYWEPAAWATLSEERMAEEIEGSDATFRTELGSGDHRMFRLPHFQWEAWERSAAVLERLGYLAESSVGANHAVTGGLPYQQAVEPWSDRPENAALLRTHPDPARRRRFLQLPISADPSDRAFPNGCCSYNSLGEGVRNRTAAPEDYRAVLQDVLDRAVAAGGLAHLFIDPPDAGYGRLEGDTRDYAGAVERWLTAAVCRDDVVPMSTAELAAWWRARADAIGRLGWHLDGDRLCVRLDDPPPGAALAVFRPDAGWSVEPIRDEVTA
ncbi:MAG: hypothetical protein ACXWYQ_06445 [Actinomycetota bacterium]